MKITLLILACSVFAPFGIAQKKGNNNSLLWEVSGNGLTTASYLFGTVHALCPADFEIKEKVKIAFAKTTQLVLEVNTADPKEMSSMMGLTMSKTPLSKQLTAVQYQKLDSILKARLNISAKVFENMKLFTVMSLLALKDFDCKNLKMWENELSKMAKSNKMEMKGLETFAEQMDIAEKAFPPNEIIEGLEKYDSTQIDKLVAQYKKEALPVLSEMMNAKDAMSAQALELMLFKRNKNWAAVLPDMMRQQSLFVAVGAGHLWHKEFGLIQLLRKAGFTVKPIF